MPSFLFALFSFSVYFFLFLFSVLCLLHLFGLEIRAAAAAATTTTSKTTISPTNTDQHNALKIHKNQWSRRRGFGHQFIDASDHNVRGARWNRFVVILFYFYIFGHQFLPSLLPVPLTYIPIQTYVCMHTLIHTYIHTCIEEC